LNKATLQPSLTALSNSGRFESTSFADSISSVFSDSNDNSICKIIKN